jgi:hypothetical protein
MGELPKNPFERLTETHDNIDSLSAKNKPRFIA